MNKSILMRIREISLLLLGLLCLVAGSVAQADGATATYFVHTDHLGTPQVMTDINQDIVWKADYNPFGMAIVTMALVENNVRFPGQYFDFETGLHYNYFRDYDPSTGRYIESDPIGLQGGVNTYLYGNGNPIRYIDPLGLESIIDWDLPDLPARCLTDYEIEVIANTIAGTAIGCAVGRSVGGCLTGGAAGGLSSGIIGTQNATPTQSAMVNATANSAVAPGGTGSSVINAVASAGVANLLPDGNPTGKASVTGAIAGGAIAGPQGYAAGASYPWLVELIKQALRDQNDKYCKCENN